MKIALSTGMIQRGKTGVAQYVFALGKALIEAGGGHEISFLVLEDDLSLFAFAEGKARVVPVAEKWRGALANIRWHQTVLPGWLRREGIDVLHVPSYRRLLWPRPCALVASIHDLAPFHVQGKYDPARMFYGRVIVRRLARRQDAVIAVSTHTARDIEHFFGIPVDRQHVILNGLDHGRFCPGDPERARASAAERWNLDQPYFLYVSRLEHPAKNHVRLIEAFTRFKAETGSPWLLALGGSDWHGAEAIHAAAAASSCRDSIRFLGFVPDEALPDLYRAAGAMVYPSLFEGFGFPPVEAMACGCPVVSSGRGSLEEVAAPAALVVDPESVPSMAEGLARVAGDPGVRQDLVQRGQRHATRFDWGDNARRVLQVYTETVEKRRAKNRAVS